MLSRLVVVSRSFPSYTARDLRNGKLQTLVFGSRPSSPTVEEGCGDKISRLVSKLILACQIMEGRKNRKKTMTRIVKCDTQKITFSKVSLGSSSLRWIGFFRSMNS